MLQITIKADYAIRVVLYLARDGANRRVSAMEIARKQEVPKALIPKILQALAHKGVLTTTAGRNGGAVLNKPANDISINEIIEAIDGPVTLNRCLREEGVCGRTGFCPVHPFWEKTRNKFVGMLKEAKIQDILDTYYNSDN